MYDIEPLRSHFPALVKGIAHFDGPGGSQVPDVVADAIRVEVLAQLRPDKLLPSTSLVPERFQLGTLPYELLAGTTAAVDFLASLADRPDADRRTRLLSAMALVESHEDGLRVASKAYEFLAMLDVNVPAGSFYAVEASRFLGLGDAGGLRVGLAPYSNESDVDRLLRGLSEFLAVPTDSHG